MLRREAEILKELDHPNIIKFKYLKEYRNYLVLALELAEGGSLSLRLKEFRNM